MPSARVMQLAGWLRRRANDVAVVLIATMFVSFLLQIFFRYVLNRPLGWTEEVTVLCWLWVVLWGASFVLDDAEEVRFDIVYQAVPARVRRAFTVVSSLAFVVLMAMSLPAAWQYVAFMRREHSAYLRIPFHLLYAIYVVFVVACIVRQARAAWRAWRGTQPTTDPAGERLP